MFFPQIVPTAKKLWAVQDANEEDGDSGIFHGEQWDTDSLLPSVPRVTQSEHAISQPINMQPRPVNQRNYNGVDQHGVLSPRSTDGVGMSVAEFVLGSSPGGTDLEAQITKMKASLVIKFGCFYMSTLSDQSHQDITYCIVKSSVTGLEIFAIFYF